MRLRAWTSLVCAVGVLVACGGPRQSIVLPPGSPAQWKLDVRASFSIAPLQRLPRGNDLPFGGISGLAAYASGAEMLGVSDAREGTRVYRLGVIRQAAGFGFEPLQAIPLEHPPGTPRLDAEGIVMTPDGTLLISSEGYGGEEPRVPPAIVEFGRHGEFVRQLEVHPRYLPNPTGPQTAGVRPNMGFESLTIEPGGGRVYSAAESALVQDGDAATFDAGSSARLLEYTRSGGSYRPRREFVYPVDAIPRPGFEAAVAINGLVELLALGGGQLLSLERAYVRESGGAMRDGHRIRIYRIDLRGATDVSGLDTLKNAAGIVPISKTLLFDLSDRKDLPPELVELDNFEGLAFGPRLPDGRPSLLVISDDNFNPRQRTWMLSFAVSAGALE